MTGYWASAVRERDAGRVVWAKEARGRRRRVAERERGGGGREGLVLLDEWVGLTLLRWLWSDSSESRRRGARRRIRQFCICGLHICRPRGWGRQGVRVCGRLGRQGCGSAEVCRKRRSARRTSCLSCGLHEKLAESEDEIKRGE